MCVRRRSDGNLRVLRGFNMVEMCGLVCNVQVINKKVTESFS